MADKRIKDYVINDNITAFFAVRRKEVREYYKGQFVSLELGDCTGRIDSKIWEPDQFSLNELEAGMVVKVRGVVTEYRDKLQLTINKIRLAQQDEYTIEDILPHSSQTIEERKARILALSEKIENSYIKTLVDSFFNDEEFLDKYLKAAAGKLWHHAYVGGLAEHSANLTELALRASAGYEFLDKDLLIFGGLFHDAGKMDSYSIETVIDYTDEGRLVDHISLTDAWIYERSRQIENFPPKLLIKLRHVILSHHGEREYGAPVVPQIPEAFIIYYCDEIDSKMGAIERLRERQGPGWTDYVNLLGRYLYLGEETGE